MWQAIGGQLSDERQKAWEAFLGGYRAQLKQEGLSDAERRKAMDAVNPLYIPRNQVMQEVIKSAEAGDFGPVRSRLFVRKQSACSAHACFVWSAQCCTWPVCLTAHVVAVRGCMHPSSYTQAAAKPSSCGTDQGCATGAASARDTAQALHGAARG